MLYASIAIRANGVPLFSEYPNITYAPYFRVAEVTPSALRDKEQCRDDAYHRADDRPLYPKRVPDIEEARYQDSAGHRDADEHGQPAHSCYLVPDGATRRTTGAMAEHSRQQIFTSAHICTCVWHTDAG
jgi:hypothetical protein